VLCVPAGGAFFSFFFLFSPVGPWEGGGEEVGDEKSNKCLPWAESRPLLTWFLGIRGLAPEG